MGGFVTTLSRTKRKGIKKIFQVYDWLMNSDKNIRYTHYTNGFHNPNYQFTKDQIASVHIPKTGGTSLNKMLQESGDARFINLNIHKPVSKVCSPEEYRYITVLRDPVDRVWSQYQMVLRSAKGYPYQKFALQGLQVFLEKCWAVRNMNCRYLTGEVEKEPDSNTLELALSNLSKFHAVFSFEHFSSQVTQFLEEKNISFSKIPNERKSSYIGPSAEDVMLIKKYNEYDLILFEKWRKKDHKAGEK